ncbi:hypothetical protein UPYG_G00129060 [Umbra pygmaea]|uniref:Uncharacterized protein n=1 Tax=Umbra pygmaea TaxID=75934 RepID=A0ABD0X6M9_UMBPY
MLDYNICFTSFGISWPALTRRGSEGRSQSGPGGVSRPNIPQRAGVISVTPQARPAHPGAPRPIPEAPGAPRPIPDTHPGAPRPAPDALTKPTDLPLGPPHPGPTQVRQTPSPMQPPMQPTTQPLSTPPAQPLKQPTAAPLQAQSKPPTQPAMQAPMQPAMQAPMQPAMQAPMQPAMQAPMQPAMQAPMQPAMQAPMQPAMQAPMQPAMQAPMQPAMQAPMQPAMQAPMQPAMQAPMQPAMHAPMQPAMQAPMQPQMAAPMLPTQVVAGPGAGAVLGAPGVVAPQGLSSPKPPPRSRSSQVLPPEGAAPDKARAAQTNGMNGNAVEVQWKPDPFDTLTSDLSASWLTTQSLTRNSSLCSSSAPPPSFSSTLPPSLSLHPTPPSTLQGFQSSPAALPPALTPSLLPPPPIPSRSRSQEALQRASPNPFLSEPMPARPNSTNPFTGPQAQQRRPLTPDFSTQQLASRSGLQSAAFTQALAPFPTFMPGAPSLLLPQTMPVYGLSSTPLTPTPAPPLLPSAILPRTVAPPLPLQSPPAPRAQRWVTFDEDSDFRAKCPPTASARAPQPQVQLTCSGFDSSPLWSSSPSAFPSLPPAIPARTVPRLPAPDSSLLPKEFTDR